MRGDSPDEGRDSGPEAMHVMPALVRASGLCGPQPEDVRGGGVLASPPEPTGTATSRAGHPGLPGGGASPPAREARQARRDVTRLPSAASYAARASCTRKMGQEVRGSGTYVTRLPPARDPRGSRARGRDRGTRVGRDVTLSRACLFPESLVALGKNTLELGQGFTRLPGQAGVERRPSGRHEDPRCRRCSAGLRSCGGAVPAARAASRELRVASPRSAAALAGSAGRAAHPCRAARGRHLRGDRRLQAPALLAR